MQTINEVRLETDLAYRYSYLAEFIGFTDQDIETIHGAAPLIAPLVGGLVDAVYDKLSSYDCTWRHFVPRQTGYEGETPESWVDTSPYLSRHSDIVALMMLEHQAKMHNLITKANFQARIARQNSDVMNKALSRPAGYFRSSLDDGPPGDPRNPPGYEAGAAWLLEEVLDPKTFEVFSRGGWGDFQERNDRVRVPGDTVFFLGAVALVVFVAGLKTGHSFRKER